MAIAINSSLTPRKLVPKTNRLFELSAEKILSLEKSWKTQRGTPVFTVRGRYTTRGWTERTQGFQYGSDIFQLDATDHAHFLAIARRPTVERMTPHLPAIGV